MLDPFSSLAVATAIAQFIDFGSELINITRKVHRAGGTLSTISDFETQLKRFQSLTNGLKESIAADAAKRQGWMTKDVTKVDGHALILVATDCEALAKEIIALLAKLKIDGTPTKLQSLKLASKITMKIKKLEEYERQLMQRKVELTTNLVAALYEDRSSVHNLFGQLKQRDAELQAMVTAKLDGFRDDLLKVARPVADGAISPDQLSATVLISSIGRLNQEMGTASKVQYLLSTLKYDAIRVRELAISDPHSKTFQWMLDERRGHAVGGSTFLRWLRNDSGLFWISGKAGSGKSTLMKFLFEQPKTYTALKIWTGAHKLVLSRHFFWNAGTLLQKSQAGLLRSLCYDIFRACPEILADVCSERLAMMSPTQSLNPDIEHNQTWTVSELLRTLDRISKSAFQNSGQKVKFCFFVDGLDEYAGQHNDIVNVLLKLAEFPNCKICVSSRPWNVFESAFQTPGRMLVLQDLTRPDIALYVKNNLEEDRHFVSMQSFNPECLVLVNEITDKAHGVFLWVILVVRELLKSIANDDDIHTLQRRLRGMPPTLDAYFQHMFDTLDIFYQAETAQIFRVAIEAPFYIPLLACSVLQLNDPIAKSVAQSDQIVDTEERAILARRLEKRIKGRCRDLLEVKDRKVMFLHRTVRDFLSTEEMITLLDARAGPQFDLNISLMRISIVGLRYLSYFLGSSRGDQEMIAWIFPSFYHHARMFEHNRQTSPFDILREMHNLIGSLSDAWVNELPEEACLLACMSLPISLSLTLGYSNTRLKASYLSELAVKALYYMRTHGHTNDIPHQLMNSTFEMDPDRREFSPDVLRVLIQHGAKTKQIWEFYLDLVHDYKRCGPEERAIYLKVAAVIVRASREPACFIEEDMATVFGQTDAEWLFRQRYIPQSVYLTTLRWVQGLKVGRVEHS